MNELAELTIKAHGSLKRWGQFETVSAEVLPRRLSMVRVEVDLPMAKRPRATTPSRRDQLPLIECGRSP